MEVAEAVYLSGEVMALFGSLRLKKNGGEKRGRFDQDENPPGRVSIETARRWTGQEDDRGITSCDFVRSPVKKRRKGRRKGRKPNGTEHMGHLKPQRCDSS